MGGWCGSGFEGGSGRDCGCDDFCNRIGCSWSLQLKGSAERSCDFRCLCVVAAAFCIIGAAATVFPRVARLELPSFYRLETVGVVGNCSGLVDEPKMTDIRGHTTRAYLLA